MNVAPRSSLMEGLISAKDRNRLGHGLLFVLPNDEWPSELKIFIQALLCGERGLGSGACGRCASCRIFERDLSEIAHPDLVLMAPDSSTGYSVEQIRDLSARFQVGRALSPCRVAVFREADRLSTGGGAAAHALLKLLEEPRPESFLVLVSSRPEGLAATIRSRVQTFRLTTASAPVTSLPDGWEGAEEWLRQGAPPARARAFETPADPESFWKERDSALEELRIVYRALWERQTWSNPDFEASRRVLDFFLRFEELIKAVSSFGNGPVQWLAFRSSSRMGL